MNKNNKKYAAFDMLDIGVQVFDKNFKYLYLNKVALKQSKYKPEEIIGHRIMDLYKGVEQTEIFRMITLCMEGEVTQRTHMEFEFQDQSEGYFDTFIQKVDDGVLILSYDVSDTIIKQNALVEDKRKLERLLNDKIKELIDKNGELEDLNKVKDKFIQILSHDIKSPLINLIGFTDMMLTNMDDFTEEELFEFYTKVRRDLDINLNMTDNLIEWVRLQMKEQTTVPEKIELVNLTNEIVDFFENQLQSKNIDLKVEVENETVWDKNQLVFVIRNLLSNAIKFTNPNGTITVRTSKHPHLGIVFSITDSGIGMSQNMIDNLFNMKKNQSRVGTKGETGSGLGLMMAYQFIKMNHGDIKVTSEVGKGTQFELYLNKELVDA